jgi:hypothetical protein
VSEHHDRATPGGDPSVARSPAGARLGVRRVRGGWPDPGDGRGALRWSFECDLAEVLASIGRPLMPTGICPARRRASSWAAAREFAMIAKIAVRSALEPV